MSAKKVGGLGRGLSALLSDSERVNDSPEKQIVSGSDPVHFMMIPIDSIKTNPYQPRTHFEQRGTSGNFQNPSRFKELFSPLRSESLITITFS